MRARARALLHTHTLYTRREREDAAYLPSRSTSLSQRNCPGRRGRSLPSPSRNREEREANRGWKMVGEGGRSYITAHEKRPSTGRLISEALPPPPFKANPRPGHESRHSAAFHPPFPSYEDERRNLSPRYRSTPRRRHPRGGLIRRDRDSGP